MSSSAPKMQRVPEAEAAPYCYADTQPGSSNASGGRADESSDDRAQSRESEAFERGRQAAEQQLRASIDAAIDRGHAQVATALAEFAQERSAYYRRVEGEVVQLALAVARKILHREAQLDPQALAGIVRITLENLDAGTKIDLRVAPSEAADWRHYFACKTDGDIVPEVHEDSTLPAGECRVETSLGTTEIGIQSQLKEIETGLLDLLAERPGADLSPVTSPKPSNAVAASRETQS